ncbi:MAG: PIG-L deacetylase family protein [Fimbriimonadales bacterium]
MRRWIFRLALAAVGGLGSYVGLSALLFVAAMHRASLSQEPHRWQPFPSLHAGDRLLIIAPHPDDEVLGCGGLIAAAVAQGAPVRVVYLTNGDGFTAAAALTARATPHADECLQLGRLRQAEASNALQLLGGSPDDAVFLGYPDRGLLPMAMRPQRVVRSHATQASAVPYSDALTPNAPYIAPALIADLRRVIEEFQPTHVFTTHPLDDHEDHTAAALFAAEALLQAQASSALAQPPRLYYYIIHRGDFPLPQGDHPQRMLIPPVGLAEAPWRLLMLSSNAQHAKRRALQAHQSQYALMTRFLSSFLRQNELFLPASLEGVAQPVNDNPTIHLQPRADLASVQAQVGREGVRVSIETVKPLRAPYQLEVTLLTVDASGNWSDARWRYPNRRLAARREGNTLHLWLPHTPVHHAERAYVLIRTTLYGAELDRTGFIQAQRRAESDAPALGLAIRYAPSPAR